MVVEGGIVSHYYVSFICRNMQHIACEQALCLGKGQKSWEEREGKGGEP